MVELEEIKNKIRVKYDSFVVIGAGKKLVDHTNRECQDAKLTWLEVNSHGSPSCFFKHSIREKHDLFNQILLD